MELVELCPDCHGDEWALVEDDRVCVQCRQVMELTEVPDGFYCPCGCDGIADLCVYAATCPDCGHKFIGGHGYGDTRTQCSDCKHTVAGVARVVNEVAVEEKLPNFTYSRCIGPRSRCSSE